MHAAIGYLIWMYGLNYLACVFYSWANCCSPWYNWWDENKDLRSCNDCKTWNWCLHCKSNICLLSFICLFYILELLMLKTSSCISGSNKPLIKGLKWRSEKQHPWWLAWDSCSIFEITITESFAQSSHPSTGRSNFWTPKECEIIVPTITVIFLPETTHKSRVIIQWCPPSNNCVVKRGKN